MNGVRFNATLHGLPVQAFLDADPEYRTFRCRFIGQCVDLLVEGTYTRDGDEFVFSTPFAEASVRAIMRADGNLVVVQQSAGDFDFLRARTTPVSGSL